MFKVNTTDKWLNKAVQLEQGCDVSAGHDVSIATGLPGKATPRTHADNQLGSFEADRKRITEFCRTYWRPVFTFIMRSGYSVPDAQDLTQDFFAQMLKRNVLSSAEAKHKRLRSMLLCRLRTFLAERAQKGETDKASGNLKFISWDDWMSETPSQLFALRGTFERVSPEKLFAVRWATTVVEHALSLLREQFENSIEHQLFDTLSNYLTVTDIDYTSLAGALDVSTSTARRLLHQLRMRYRNVLRSEIAQTVGEPSEIDSEIQDLSTILADIDKETGEPPWSRWLTAHRETLAIGMARSQTLATAE